MPFVWGHGLTSSCAVEDDDLLMKWDALADVTRLVRYDARGHGESSTPTDPLSYRWSEMALDQLALMSALGIDRYIAGGASLGAATALHAAVSEPDRIAGLVMAIPPTAWETRSDQQALYTQMASILDTKGLEPIITALASLDPADPLVGRPEFEGRSEARLRAVGADRLATVFRGASTADLPPRDAVAQIDVPTLVLAWTGDPGHPVSTAEELSGLIDGCELSVASNWDEYRGWTAQVAEFLERIAVSETSATA